MSEADSTIDDRGAPLPDDADSARDGAAADPVVDKLPVDPELALLRRVLVGVDVDELSASRNRIEDPQQRTRVIAEVLAEAVTVRNAQDDRLGAALGGTIENALHQSISRNPTPVANAIYPVIGPSVRKAITAALEGMVQSLNLMLEQSLSLRSLRWRVEAWRAGQPFAEYVLLKTLAYRVEQLFLIHRETGLKLAHIAADAAIEQDPDMVSGMLTAIQDYLRDSFAGGSGDRLQSMKMGDLTVMVESGPYAVLAAVVRGTPPAELQGTIEHTLEQIHLARHAELADFSGDDTPFETVRPLMENCMLVKRREEERRRSPWKALLLLAVALLVFSGWQFMRWQQAQRVEAALAVLEEEPGYVLTSIVREGQQWSVRSLQDPMARPLDDVLAEHLRALPSIDFHAVPFQSLLPELTQRRVLESLTPPPGVAVSIDGPVLRVAGNVPGVWFDQLVRRDLGAWGIRSIDTSAANRRPTVVDRASAERFLIEKWESRFPPESADLPETARTLLESVAAAFINLQTLLPEADLSLRVMGETDGTGTTTLNTELSIERAVQVRDALIAAGISSDQVTASGAVSVDGVVDAERRRTRIFVVGYPQY